MSGVFGGGAFALANLIVLVLGVAAFVTEVYALIDALRHRPDAYTAAGKLTKQKWTLILGVAVLLGFVMMVYASVLSLFAIAPFVAAAVYLADVRPALQSASGRGGSGSHMGPYGPW
jgi:hypothetical protein